MASPPKPWEKPGVNRQTEEDIHSSFMSAPTASGFGSTMSAGSPTIGGGDAPPPVPSRPSQGVGYSSYSPGGYGGYSSPYSSGMYSSPYSGMYGYGSGMYGGYSGYGGYGYNRYGQQNYNEYNSFSRMAEESSRPAFQSIESIVGAFTSVSMMLDSTFQAVYNSFRAVIGVADNFSRMRIQFAQIFSAFALFRTLRYLYRKLLVFLRLRPQGFAEEAWVEAGDTVAQNAAASSPGGGKSSWPVLMFFAIIMGGPWLIWKFLRATFANPAEQGWATGTEDHFVARALYDFKGEGTDELSFQAGANLHVAPKELQPRMKGWLLASVDGKTVGIIPANYVKVLGKRRGTKVSNYPVPNELKTFDSQNREVPNEIPSQTGPLPYSSSNTAGSQNGPSLVQSQSAINFENQAQSGFGGDLNVPNMDSVFQAEPSPLDSVPEIPSSEQNEPVDKS